MAIDQRTSLVRRVLVPLVGTVLSVIGLSAHATLLGRDIDGRPVAADAPTAVFEYDTDQNLTWLRNWNFNAGNGSSGRMMWGASSTWASALTVGLFGGWRLPTADPSCGLALNCVSSEIGHIWYTELGNVAGAFTRRGPFVNMQSGAYWTGTVDATNPRSAWYFYIDAIPGYQAPVTMDLTLYAVAVRPGDVAVAAVPEPGIPVLMLGGLGGLALARRATAVRGRSARSRGSARSTSSGSSG